MQRPLMVSRSSPTTRAGCPADQLQNAGAVYPHGQRAWHAFTYQLPMGAAAGTDQLPPPAPPGTACGDWRSAAAGGLE